MNAKIKHIVQIKTKGNDFFSELIHKTSKCSLKNKYPQSTKS